jgi:flagellar biosynthetic protein FliR
MQGFFWVLVRVSVLLFFLPFFGARGVPTLWKVGLSLVLTVMLTPVVPLPRHFPQSGIEIALAITAEAVIGLMLSFAVKALLSSVQLAGQFMSFQMGFSMARAIDPQTGVQSTSLAQFLYLFTVLIFFSIDGHHLFLQALAASFTLVPPNGLSVDSTLPEILIRVSARMFLIALKIAAPLMIALFLSNLCLGIVARTVPQVNILMIGFPLNIGLGLVIFGLVLRNLSPFLLDMTQDMGEILMRLLRLM